MKLYFQLKLIRYRFAKIKMSFDIYSAAKLKAGYCNMTIKQYIYSLIIRDIKVKNKTMHVIPNQNIKTSIKS